MSVDWDTVSGKGDSRQRYCLYRLCVCETCDGRGMQTYEMRGEPVGSRRERCEECHGEGRVRQLLATCETPEAVGVAIVTLGREGEFAECPIGLLDREGETNQKWILLPWLPADVNVRNVSQAGRMLAKSRQP